ncbi:hypothetical protein CC80DRAFT_482184 [Byssothecium circinans]|uniref:RNA exonuclease 4 n=1 Tax=Byssothecium circinans TaxID=147558 RepID=A0A6A5TB22_9PLEO|nr:hypothetical protein CC80DRAFT_599321 [Byssothecium circinans]KAF1950839.1 hypothetical protein CC80DRAFT_482184 [Byssothecium circinans]
MAPVEMSNLSSNWKKLQASLKTKPAPAPTTRSKSTSTAENSNSLKRKRSEITANGERKGPVKGAEKRTPQKTPPSRKRQKMEEPASIGASPKHHNPKTLSKSLSMPSLKQTPLLSASKNAADAISVLTPSPSFPDIENEGVSPLALPAKYIALDCEMVGIGPEPDKDSALARVSAVNYHGHQVYDSYVQMQPKIRVTDYRTSVSGILPHHIHKSTARTFKEVHNDLKILLEGRILVGHGVKNDLDALLLGHDKRYIRDTSKYSKFRELAMIPGRTPSLKILAEKLLGVVIQTGAHSSVEDARVTMALFRLEKEGFDIEVRERYGNIRPEATAVEVDVGGGEAVKRKSKNRKKKKKKKN